MMVVGSLLLRYFFVSSITTVQLQYQVCTIKQTVEKGFLLIGRTQAAAEVKDGVVITQGQGLQETFQFLEAFADFGWIGVVGFCIGLVELIENGFRVAAPGIKGMVARVSIQCFGKRLQDNTS